MASAVPCVYMFPIESVKCGVFCSGGCGKSMPDYLPAGRAVYNRDVIETVDVSRSDSATKALQQDTHFEIYCLDDNKPAFADFLVDDITETHAILPNCHRIYLYLEKTEEDAGNRMASLACGGSSFVCYRISPRSDTKCIVGTYSFPNWDDGRWVCPTSGTEADTSSDDSSEEDR